MCMKFTTFWKKGWVSLPHYFRNYCFGRRFLLKRLEDLASKHHSVINVLTGSKHRWKLQGTTIIVFSHEFQVNWVGKSLIYSDLKSQDFLLTHWLPMISIPPQYAEFPATTSKAFISKTENFFWIFYSISEMWIKFRTFWKKGWVS